VTGADLPHPDPQPGDERTALVQRLDQYRAIAAAALVDLEWEEASTCLLPATDLTIAGIVKHLAWAEDRWFQGRLLGVPMPAPWDAPGADDPDQAMRLASDDTVAGIVQLYSSACSRSRSALARCDSLDHVAVVPSFGIGPVNLRWILIHMIDETARHRSPRSPPGLPHPRVAPWPFRPAERASSRRYGTARPCSDAGDRRRQRDRVSPNRLVARSARRHTSLHGTSADDGDSGAARPACDHRARGPSPGGSR
jgi:Protein of unknown function (DUF664)